MKHKNYVSRLTLLFFISLILTNCQIEEDIKNEKYIQTVKESEAIAFLKEVNNKSHSKKGTVNNLFPDFNGLKQEKLTNTDQLLTVIPLLKNNKQENSRILLLKIHNKIRSAIFTIYPEKGNSGSEFSGRVIISNLNGEFVNGFRVYNGYIISNFTKKNNNNSTYKTIDLEEVIIPVRLKASKANTAFIFPGDSPGSSLDDYTWNPDYLNGGGGGNGGDTKPENIAQAIEDKIDDSKLDPCTKSVIEQLKNITNYDIAQVLTKLGANKSVYNTTMISAVAPSGNPAQTIRTSAYNYKIYISTDYENKTKLFIASLQLHELVHTNFFSLIDDCLIQNNCQLLVTFPELWEYYVSVCDNQYPSNPSSHHEQIANSYVTAISAALQEYQPGLPQQVYEDLAWNGLEGTTVFNTLHPIGSASRQRILNRKAAEQSGHPVAEGTSQEQINYGQPCN